MLEQEFTGARASLQRVISGLSTRAKIVIVADVDADGLSAVAVFSRLLERLGYAPFLVLPDRTRNVWTSETRSQIAAQSPDFLFVLDLGCRAEKVLDGVPTCFIDHHRPEGILSCDTLITGYGWDPIPNTSWMIWEIGREIADLSQMDWVAVVGTLSDLGEKASWPLLGEARAKYKAKWLREATALVNAARRASDFTPHKALEALLLFPNPCALCQSEDEPVASLKRARVEVASAFQEGKKAAPAFAGQVALVRVNSPCQIHPLLAQVWRGRLPKYHVLCANEGYIPGRINFSARSQGENKVLELLKSVELSGEEGHFGHGHDHASGGSLPISRWNELLEKLGFGPQVWAKPEPMAGV